jgi:SAM-dependent methyltransferase
MGRATDYRTASSIAAQQRVLDQCDSGKTVLGLGGGPFRIHPRIINLNIEPFENVDLVGDAHKLPLASASIDAVHCEAVFEHLRDPHDAAAELFRVMKPGAIGYVCTPWHAGLPRVSVALPEFHAHRPSAAFRARRLHDP